MLAIALGKMLAIVLGKMLALWKKGSNMGDQQAIDRELRDKGMPLQSSSTIAENGKEAVDEPLSPTIEYSKHARRGGGIRPAHLIFFGCACEFLYLVIFVLSPLPGLHLSASPLPTTWRWTLWPTQFLFPLAWHDSHSANVSYWQFSVLLGVTFIALALTYLLTIRSMMREQDTRETDVRWLYLLLGGAAIFGCTLLLQPMLFSDNVFTYIFSGRILAIYHADPLNNAPIQFPLDPFLRWIGVAERNSPNIYGPLWLYISSALAGIKASQVVTLLLFKGLALLSHLLNCILVWLILGKIAPRRKLLGTLLYAWNPLAIIELAGNGHNEGLLLSLFLLAMLVHIWGASRWREVAVMVLLGCAVSINLVALLIAPMYAWFVVRDTSNPFRAIWGMCWRMAVVLAITLLMYFPFWRGASTFFAIMSIIDIQQVVNSSIGLLSAPAHWAFTQVDKVSQFPPVMQANSAADTTLRATSIFIFALIYFQLFGKIRRAPKTIAGMHYEPTADHELQIPGFDVLLDCLSCAIFWFLVLVLGSFWPWYVLWALWIVVLRRLDGLSIAILILTNTALLVYPFLALTHSVLILYRPLLIFGLPFVFLVLAWKRQRERLRLVT